MPQDLFSWIPSYNYPDTVLLILSNMHIKGIVTNAFAEFNTYTEILAIQ